MRAHAAAFLSDIEAKPNSPEASVAHRVCGITHQFAGEYIEARGRFRTCARLVPARSRRRYRRSLRMWTPAWAAMLCLAFASWPLGDVERATSLAESALTRIASDAPVVTIA